MATHYAESGTTTYPTPTYNKCTGLEVFDKAETEINSHFTWLRQILNEKNKAILDKLREKRAEFAELEAARVRQIEEIETMKQQLLNLGVKSNHSNVLREQTIKGYDDEIKILEIPIRSKINLENFTNEIQTLISVVDLKFEENIYRTRNKPMLSIDKDLILQSINTIKLKETSYLWGWGKGKDATTIKSIELFKIEFASETNRLFVLNRKSNNILVFQQDGTLTACFGEEFEDLTDICIDSKNNFIFVLDKQNSICKFNLTTYKLLKKKENDFNEINNEMYCLDIYNGEIFVGTENSGVHVFNSELKFIRSISTNTIGCLDIICREEDILIFSLFPEGLNLYSKNGDFIRYIPLSFVLRLKDFENFKQIGVKRIPLQLSLDKTGSILVSNPFEHCFDFHTFDGELIHKIDISVEEEVSSFPAGVTCSSDGSVIVTVLNSKYPLRYY